MFQVGDNVVWTHTAKLADGYSFLNRKGKIVDIGKDWVRVREEYSRATVYLRKSEIKLAEESDQELTSLINSIQGGGLG